MAQTHAIRHPHMPSVQHTVRCGTDHIHVRLQICMPFSSAVYSAVKCMPSTRLLNVCVALVEWVVLEPDLNQFVCFSPCVLAYFYVYCKFIYACRGDVPQKHGKSQLYPMLSKVGSYESWITELSHSEV